MSMSKKDFVALADTIRAFNSDAVGRAHYKDAPYFSTDQINTLAGFCQSQNSRFKKDRWLSYIAGECGPGGGAVAEYIVQGNYGQGWEDVTAEDTRSEGRARLREYRENDPSHAHRMITRRAEA